MSSTDEAYAAVYRLRVVRGAYLDVDQSEEFEAYKEVSATFRHSSCALAHQMLFLT